jgi:cleavage stimulation factor subunit 3
MEAQNKDISIVRDIYERFLKQFPTAGRFWKLYAEHEMAAKNYDNVAKIFSRCLLYVPNIDLWKSYLNFVQLTKTSREEMIKAYEFALEYMSMDIFSTVIWKDYINFIKEVKPKNQYEEGQQINLLRKLYQRAIRNPMNNLEDIWKEYDAYENELNKLLAKSLLNEQSPTYMKVRATSRFSINIK